MDWKPCPKAWNFAVLALFVEVFLAEPGLRKPGLEMQPVPAVEADLANVELVEEPAQIAGDELIFDRRRRSCPKQPVSMPDVVGNPVRPGLLPQAFSGSQNVGFT
jgi:hypothetical protein